jgi:hypothetical protein
MPSAVRLAPCLHLNLSEVDSKCGLDGALKEPILSTAQVIDIEALARFPRWRTVARALDGNHRLKSGNKEKQTIHRL